MVLLNAPASVRFKRSIAVKEQGPVELGTIVAVIFAVVVAGPP
jgi:hypothetical protein